LAVPLEVEEIAVRIRKQLADDGWDHGPITVRHSMLQLGIAAPSASTLARIFTYRGMVVAQPQKRPRSSWRRFQFEFVHQCWQLDATEWWLFDGTQVVIFQLLDDHARFMIASHAASGENSDDAIVVARKGIAAHQVPQLLLTDNGQALNPTRRGQVGQLVSYLQGLGTKPISGRPYHPQTQGKDERVHSTLKRWLRARPKAVDLAGLQTQLDEFDWYYNNIRPHQALGMRSPAQAMADDTWAVPPDPPAPSAPADAGKPAAGLRVRHLKVASNGTACANNKFIQLGREHVNARVLAVIDGDLVTIFDAHGTLIRAVTLVEGTRYYGNDKPKWRRINREVSTMT
jgi:putative transposase